MSELTKLLNAEIENTSLHAEVRSMVIAYDKAKERIAELEKGISRRDEDCQKLQAIMDENAELEAENERLRDVCVEFEHRASEERIQQSNQNAEHHEKIMKQAIEWKKDAERYRLHRTGDHSDVLMEVPPNSDNWEALTGEALDKATDAAMEGE